MSNLKKFLWWSLAVLGMAIAALLLYLVVTKDLGTADQLASVVGAIVGLAALGVSVYALTRSEPIVHAADGSNAARGAIRNASAVDTTQNLSSPTTNEGISATGGSNAAAGDIDGSTARKGQ